MIKFDFKKNFVIQKYGDILLLALALAILAGALLRFIPRGAGDSEERGFINITFTQWWQNELEEGFLESLIEEFESLNSGIGVILDTRSYEEIWQGFFDPYEETGPFTSDVLALDSLWLSELLSRGIIESPGPALISPINVFYYNIDILSEAGFSRPPRNRSEVIEYSREILSLGRQAIILDLESPRGLYDNIFPWIGAAGAALINNGNPTVNTNTVVNILAFFAALNGEGLILHGRYGSEEKIEDFINGRAAFMVANAMKIDHVREQMGEDSFSITSIPTPDNYAGRTFFSAFEWTLGINSASEHKAESRLFMNFLAENLYRFSRAAGEVPSEKITANDPIYSKVWEIAMAGDIANDFINMPWNELKDVFDEELDALFKGLAGPGETAAAIQRRWGLIINE
ncbi:MAG: extracellular solute-binding protein [Treponema sp.]|nr:extracellular solute-binding protein [Treponema sp.]